MVCGERCEPSAVAQHKTVNTGTLPNRRQSRVRSPAVRFVRGTVHAHAAPAQGPQPRGGGAGRGRPGGDGAGALKHKFLWCSVHASFPVLSSISFQRHRPDIYVCETQPFVHWSRAQGRRPLLFRGSPRSPHARGATARANAFLSVGDTTGGHVRACGSVSSHGLPFVVKITPAILTALHLGGRGLLHASCGRG